MSLFVSGVFASRAVRVSTLAAIVAIAGSALQIASALPRVFIDTDVGSLNPYVQAATRVTVRVYSARALYHPDLDLPATADALVRQIGNDEHGTVERDGRSYDVLTRQYLVFPQHSGKLSLPGAVLSAQVLTSSGRDPFRNDPSGALGGPSYGYGGSLSIAVEPLRLRGASIALDVRPRPAGAVGSYWLPARQVTLSSVWQPETLQARAGDALTLDVTVQAVGLTAEQLPDVTTLLKVPPGLKVYPEEPKLDNFNQGDTVVGRRQQSVALIADRPGQFTLPALHLTWWDTARDTAQEVLMPARTLAILTASAPPPVGAARNAAGNSAPLEGNSSPGAGPWRWATLALGAAWLLTLAAWYAQRRRGPPPPRLHADVPPASPDIPRERARFLEACERDDPRAARRHLIAWVSAQWPRSPPAGLNGLARRIGDAEIEGLLRELDRACFAGGAWRGGSLAQRFAKWPPSAAGAGRRPDGRGKDRKSPLAPLYP